MGSQTFGIHTESYVEAERREDESHVFSYRGNQKKLPPGSGNAKLDYVCEGSADDMREQDSERPSQSSADLRTKLVRFKTSEELQDPSWETETPTAVLLHQAESLSKDLGDDAPTEVIQKCVDALRDRLGSHHSLSADGSEHEGPVGSASWDQNEATDASFIYMGVTPSVHDLRDRIQSTASAESIEWDQNEAADDLRDRMQSTASVESTDPMRDRVESTDVMREKLGFFQSSGSMNFFGSSEASALPAQQSSNFSFSNLPDASAGGQTTYQEADRLVQRFDFQVHGSKLDSREVSLVLPIIQVNLHGFYIPFRVHVLAKKVHHKRFGQSFKTARGTGFLKLKCDSLEFPMETCELNFSFGVGTGNSAPTLSAAVKHDFVNHSIAGLPSGKDEFLWDFRAAVDPNSKCFSVYLGVD